MHQRREFAQLAELHGTVTGAAGEFGDAKVERELRRLREMRIDFHRPLTLRLPHDASGNGQAAITAESLAKVLGGIGTWTTRLWLADRPTPGMNKAVAELAHGHGPREGQDFEGHWLGRIRRLRSTRIGVPSDEAVRRGSEPVKRTEEAPPGPRSRSCVR